jgi:ABC-type lipoprotein release transport system permease subunit
MHNRLKWFTTARIAWRNLGRNKRRTLLALGAIALGQLTLVFVNCMMAGMYEEMLQTVTGQLVGHVQVHHPKWRKERAMDLYIDSMSKVKSEIESLPDVETVLPRTYAPVLAAPGKKTDEPADAEPAVVIGIDVDLEVKPSGLLHMLASDYRPSGKSVVLGKVLANRLGVDVGGQVAVIGQDIDGFPATDLFTIKAAIRSGVDVVLNRGIVMDMEQASVLLAMPDQAHEIVVRGTDYRRADELAADIAELEIFSDAEVLPWRQVVPNVSRMLDMKSWIDLVFVAVVFVAAAAGIANTAMMSTFERTHEFGMLLALGTTPWRIIRMILIESVVLGLIGVTIGSLVGVALVFVTSQTGINYAALAGADVEDIAFAGINVSYVIYPLIELRHVIFGVLAVTATSVLASTWPAMLAARLEPVEAMRS